MDTWATSSLTPQIVCGWRSRSRFLRAHVSDGLASAGARHHPHVALRHGACGRSSSTTRCRGLTRRSPDSSLDPDRKKMSKSKGNVVTPDGVARGARFRRRALLGRERQARKPTHAFDTNQMTDRPAAGDQAAERLAVRASTAEPVAAGITATVDRAMLSHPRRPGCRIHHASRTA